MGMKKILVLLAGYPGTGKTYLSELINEKLGSFNVVSPDKIKEHYFDVFGYKNIEEKQHIEVMAWESYFKRLKAQMGAGINLISDYPFSAKQLPRLENLSESYGYNVLTIRLTADLNVLFERQKERDLSESRHLSHIVTSYQKGDQLKDRSTADNLLAYEEFVRRCTTRGYETFKLGKLLEVEVTDFSRVNYFNLLEAIRLWAECTVKVK